MKTPLRIFDMSVRMKWDIEKAAEYEEQIMQILKFMDRTGKPLTIEYIDDDLNVISTSKFKGDEKKALEYEARINKLTKGLYNENRKRNTNAK